MMKKVSLVMIGFAVSCIGAFAQKHYNDTESAWAQPPVGVDLVGDLSYSFYKSETGKVIKDGPFKFSATRKGTINRVTFSTTYSLSGEYKDGNLHGKITAKGYDTASSKDGKQTIDYGANLNLKEGAPEGSQYAWYTDSSKPNKWSVRANVKNGNLVGKFEYIGFYESTFSITGQFTDDGLLDGEWTEKVVGNILISTFKNGVLIDGDRNTWTDELKKASVQYAEGAVTKEELEKNGFMVHTRDFSSLECFGSFISSSDYLSLNSNYFGEIDFSCQYVTYEYLTQNAILNQSGVDKILSAYEEHIKNHKDGLIPSSLGGDSSYPLADYYYESDDYMVLLRYPTPIEEYITGDPNARNILISKEQYDSINLAIAKWSKQYAIHFYEFLKDDDRRLLLAGETDALLDKYGANSLSVILNDAMRIANGDYRTNDEMYNRKKDSNILYVVPEKDEHYLDVTQFINIEKDYKNILDEINRHRTNARKKSIMDVVYESMSAAAPKEPLFSMMNGLKESLNSALEFFEDGKIFIGIENENAKIKSAYTKEIYASTTAVTSSLIGDGVFSSMDGMREYIERIKDAKTVQSNVSVLMSLYNDALSAKKEIESKYQKIYKDQYKTFSSNFTSNTPKLAFTSKEDQENRIESCMQWNKMVSDFADMCNLADKMNNDLIILNQTIEQLEKDGKSVRKELKPFLKELDRYNTKPEFKTIDDVQAKIALYQEMQQKITDFKDAHNLN